MSLIAFASDTTFYFILAGAVMCLAVIWICKRQRPRVNVNGRMIRLD